MALQPCRALRRTSLNIVASPTPSGSPSCSTPSGCASQYYPATPSDFSTWGLTTQWYAQNIGNAVAATHFVIDTSRNGDGPNNVQGTDDPAAGAWFPHQALQLAQLASPALPGA